MSINFSQTAASSAPVFNLLSEVYVSSQDLTMGATSLISHISQRKPPTPGIPGDFASDQEQWAPRPRDLNASPAAGQPVAERGSPPHRATACRRRAWVDVSKTKAASSGKLAVYYWEHFTIYALKWAPHNPNETWKLLNMCQVFSSLLFFCFLLSVVLVLFLNFGKPFQGLIRGMMRYKR